MTNDVREDLLRYRRDTLKRGTWEIGQRAKTSAITLHWNGPTVADERRSSFGALRQLFIDVEWQTRPGWSNTKNGADGLQYHAAIDADGTVWQCRDEQAMLWHCGHQVGNRESLSLHLLIGQGQQPTLAQWDATLALIDHWRYKYTIPIARVLGHQEWTASQCPGPFVMERLHAYRRTPTPIIAPPPAGQELRRFTVALPASASATVREGPSRAYPIVAHLRPGQQLWASPGLLDDEQGEVIAGQRRWVHMAYVPDQQADLGFVHVSALKEV